MNESQSAGTAHPSMLSNLLEAHQKDGFISPTDEFDLKMAAGILYSGQSKIFGVCVLL